MTRQELIDFFTSYWGADFLAQWRIADTHGANGIQIKGREEVKKIALGVSLNQDFLDRSVDWGADTCVLHHGERFEFFHFLLPGYIKNRLKTIFTNDLNIFGFHGVMDAHPKYGHNALILRNLKGEVLGRIMNNWGFYGDLSERARLDTISEKCQQLFDHEIFVVGKPSQMIKRVGVCSGGGIPNREQLADLSEKEIELFITGEISESRPHLFSESEICYFSCGHYATEKIGLYELERNLKKEFSELETKFIDITNPL
ncbi:MAG TPA: Nif3-like dinuclear metal center hexameric protein [Candidatus Bathyarchaeia archaeon]|nr:Nif3-like dinuclear metal center hexameric protein [Candidatus Bathyarchaeia archaeon]